MLDAIIVTIIAVLAWYTGLRMLTAGRLPARHRTLLYWSGVAVITEVVLALTRQP
jgi:hypothetical protein